METQEWETWVIKAAKGGVGITIDSGTTTMVMSPLRSKNNIEIPQLMKIPTTQGGGMICSVVLVMVKVTEMAMNDMALTGRKLWTLFCD